MHERLKNTAVTQEQLWQISPIYCLLDFHKDDFCKLVKAIGLEKWLEKAERWKRLDTAEQELSAKERYIRAKSRLEELADEKAELEKFVNGYKPI
jgi:hypothetical protein